MSSSSSLQTEQEEFSHRQGSIMTIPDEDDQITTTSEPLILHQTSSINLDQQIPIENESQIASLDLQTVPDIINEDEKIISPANSEEDLTTSFGFQQTIDVPREISPSIDYETIVRKENLFFDPNPELVRKPLMITPVVYKQNIKIKFLKPPSIPLGPLIIKEVRPPQPPPPPPLIIRQRPIPPLSPPPIILRERPPKVPAILTTQFLTKTLPPLPPPPRSVIIEKLPPLPPKPRDIIIERWIPYESTTFKRKVIVQRAEPIKLPPPPRNLIITYDRVDAKIVREFRRHGITPENPETYAARYGDSLLETKDLLLKVKELGITEDLSLPAVIDQELQDQNSSYEKNNFYENSLEKENNNPYAPTYENLVSGFSPDYNENLFEQENVSTQLAQFGLTPEAIPY